MDIEGEEAIADAVSDAVTPAIETAVADAVERQEAREEIASVIADAAMETERMREVADLRGSVEECQRTLEALPPLLAEQTRAQMDELWNQLASRLSAVEGALANPTPLVVVPNPSESTPPTLVEVPTTEAEIVAPSEQPAPASEAAPEPPAPRRKRFRSI